MLRQARALGPTFLIPLAWTFVGAAHLDVVTDRTLFIAHLVMAVLLAVFAVTGRSEMRDGALRTWWLVIAVGFGATVFGAVGFRVGSAQAVLQGAALFGWMLLPAVGFLDTGRRSPDRPWLYVAAAVGCVAGAAVYAFGLLASDLGAQLAGIAVVGVGQTIGILDAAFLQQ